MADCSCGRSPTGKCVGWHGLSEQQYQERKSNYDEKQNRKVDAEQLINVEAELLRPPAKLGAQMLCKSLRSSIFI